MLLLHKQNEHEKVDDVNKSRLLSNIIVCSDFLKVGFIDYVIKEVWQKWIDFNKDDKIILDNLKVNREYFSVTSNCKECNQFCDITKSKL